MNKKTLIIVCSILLVIIGAGAYLVTKPSAAKLTSPVAEKMVTNVKTVPEITPSTPVATTKPGAYIDYADGIIASTTGTKILYFHAPWCTQCRELEKDIKARGVPSSVTIIKVDYDSNQALRKKYGVTIQTTTVLVDGSGNLVKKYVAYDEPTIDSVIKNLL